MKKIEAPMRNTAASSVRLSEMIHESERAAVAAFKERLRKRLNERYFFEMDAPLLMAPSQFGKLLKLIDETP